MDLYSHKISQYLNTEGQKAQNKIANNQNPTPFFMMATLQSMHAPFPNLYDYTDQCRDILSASQDWWESQSDEYKEQRHLYCELTLMTDRVVGEIVDGLKSNDLYENTLIIFTADNGGDTDNGASNYPFRGTKGEFYEGNTRVITSISGGIIESAGLAGTVRDELFSNLDWTPTLLQFAGYLSCIDPRDYTWDGRNQYGLIMNLPDYDSSRDSRNNLILNIGDPQLKSARIILEHEGKRYKYLKSDNTSALDRWIYSGRLSDVWTVPDYSLTVETDNESDGDDYYGSKSLPAVQVIEYDEENEKLMFSQHYHDAFLFDLSEDPSELYNLLHPDLGHFDGDLNAVVVAKCEQLLAQWLIENSNEMFSPPMDWLHQRLPSGDPGLLGDGKFVRPFLSDKEYRFLISDMFESEENYIPQKLQDLYLNPWVVPQRQGMEEEERRRKTVVASITDAANALTFGELDGSVMVPMVFGLCVVLIQFIVIVFYQCRRKTDEMDRYQYMAMKGKSVHKVDIGYGSMG